MIQMIHHPQFKKRTIDYISMELTLTAADHSDRKMSTIILKSFQHSMIKFNT